MTDFLQRLAERVLGLASLAQPLIAPAYAPQPKIMELEAVLDSREAQPEKDGDAVHEIEAGELLFPSFPSQNETVIQSVIEHATLNNTTIIQASDALPTLPQMEVAAELPEVAPDTRSTGANNQKIEGGTTPSPIVLLEQEEKIVPFARPFSSEASTSAPFPVGAKQQEDIQPTAANSVRRSPLAVAPLTTRSTMKHSANVLYRQEPLAEKKQKQTQEQSPQMVETVVPPPSIHVTIGRIEVRAVPATTTKGQTKQQRATPAGMSLDDYLQRRTQGGPP